MADKRVSRLVNLLQRGRGLSYDNARLLFRRATGQTAPAQMPYRTDLVYKAGQLAITLLFIESRAYLSDAAYDPFTDAVFSEVAGGDSERLYDIVQVYGGAISGEGGFEELFARDLAAATVGEVHPDVAQAFAKSARSLTKMTQLYCAMTFDDRVMVRRLQ